MPGKSIEEILEKILLEKQHKDNKEKEENRKINEIREKSRQEYLRRNKMYENLSINPTSDSVSSGGGGKINSLVKSYITILDTTWIYPIVDLNKVIVDDSLYVLKFGNRIIFNDIDQLYNFYSLVFQETSNSQPIGNVGYSLGVGTKLKDLEDTIVMELIDETKIIEWRLVKQLTSQSDLPVGGNSPDNSEGYIVTYCDWDNNGEQDPLDLIPITIGFENGDPLRIEEGPYINK
jgi:hypothetical protein